MITILTAVSAKIEPYSVSDEALELAFVESAEYFSLTDRDAQSEYSPPLHFKAVSLAAMRILSNLRSLGSENIGGLSNSYNPAKIEAMIRSIARLAGLSSNLVGVEDGGDAVIRCKSVW